MCNFRASLVEYSTSHLLHLMLLSCSARADPEAVLTSPVIEAEEALPIDTMSMLPFLRPFSRGSEGGFFEHLGPGGPPPLLTLLPEEPPPLLLLPRMFLRSFDSTVTELPVERVIVTDPGAFEDEVDVVVDVVVVVADDGAAEVLEEAAVVSEADTDPAAVVSLVVLLLLDEEVKEEDFTGEIVTLPSRCFSAVEDESPTLLLGFEEAFVEVLGAKLFVGENSLSIASSTGSTAVFVALLLFESLDTDEDVVLVFWTLLEDEEEVVVSLGLYLEPSRLLLLTVRFLRSMKSLGLKWGLLTLSDGEGRILFGLGSSLRANTSLPPALLVPLVADDKSRFKGSPVVFVLIGMVVIFFSNTSLFPSPLPSLNRLRGGRGGLLSLLLRNFSYSLLKSSGELVSREHDGEGEGDDDDDDKKIGDSFSPLLAATGDASKLLLLDSLTLSDVDSGPRPLLGGGLEGTSSACFAAFAAVARSGFSAKPDGGRLLAASRLWMRFCTIPLGSTIGPPPPTPDVLTSSRGFTTAGESILDVFAPILTGLDEASEYSTLCGRRRLGSGLEFVEDEKLFCLAFSFPLCCCWQT